MKPKHQRLIFLSVSMLFLVCAALLTLRAFRDNLVFFYSPTELSQRHEAPERLLRVGGLVAEGSIIKDDAQHVRFSITDGEKDIAVEYTGILPALFREGQGVVAEGHLEESGRFTATTILAKHDEKYMPREVVESLKKSGRWKGGP